MAAQFIYNRLPTIRQLVLTFLKEEDIKSMDKFNQKLPLA
jgi:hypothetical protein